MSAGAVAGLKCTEAVAVRRFDEERIMGTNLRGASSADFTHNRGRRSARLCKLLHKRFAILNAITSPFSVFIIVYSDTGYGY